MGICKKRLVMIGSGGHAKSILSSMSINKVENFEGYTDLAENLVFSKYLKYLGDDNEFVSRYSCDTIELILGISYLGNKVDGVLRKKLIEFYLNKGFNFGTIVSTDAYVSKDAEIGKGSFIAPGVKIISNAIISSCCSINTGAIIEHDTFLQSNVQISPGSIICGGVTIGENTFIGAGSIIRDGLSIANNSIIGMGSVVTRSIDISGVYYGNPLKRLTH